MALRIRLSRGGAKKRPYYSIVVADSRSPRDGRFIERLGAYNPMLPREHAERVVLVQERVKYWLDQGAIPSDRVARFFSDADLMPPRERREQTKKHLPKAKAQERLRQEEERRAEAEEAAAAEDADTAASAAAAEDAVAAES